MAKVDFATLVYAFQTKKVDIVANITDATPYVPTTVPVIRKDDDGNDLLHPTYTCLYLDRFGPDVADIRVEDDTTKLYFDADSTTWNIAEILASLDAWMDENDRTILEDEDAAYKFTKSVLVYDQRVATFIGSNFNAHNEHQVFYWVDKPEMSCEERYTSHGKGWLFTFTYEWGYGFDD